MSDEEKDVSILDAFHSRNYVKDPSISDARYQICKACPELIKLTTQCKKCGCLMKVKTKLQQAVCPLGKW
jgi:hypothetical protein